MHWAQTFDVTEVWRFKYPQDKMYSRFSSTHRSGSRIDLAFCSRAVLGLVRSVDYLPAGMSDHALLELRVWGQRCWHLDAKWLLNNKVHELVDDSGAQYWEENEGPASPQMVLDAFKAHTYSPISPSPPPILLDILQRLSLPSILPDKASRAG